MRAQARVNVAAIERNVAALAARTGPGTELCAVVKADGYGHGAVAAARAARAAGAAWLAVAAAHEATELRAAGVDGRLVVLGALGDDELPATLAAEADVVAWEPGFVAALATAARAAGRTVDVHVKLDTGMGRLGTRDPDGALALCDAVAADPDLRLHGVLTHFATADDDADFLARQLERFVAWVERVRVGHPTVVAHAANSAALLREPASHLDVVRPGVAIYGLDPFGVDPASWGLEPALELVSRLGAVKACAPGESVGYGRRFVATRPTTVGVVPVGYGDGYRRGLGGRACAVVGGRRVPLAGTVSMDNVGLDLGPEAGERPGDEVVLIGRRGPAHVGAEELARLLGTIDYEITCGLLPRVPRVLHRDGVPLGAADAARPAVDGRAGAAPVRPRSPA